jgi:hypothetical protein
LLLLLLLLQIAEDWRLDPQLFGACSASAEKLCQDAEPGAEVDCLVRDHGSSSSSRV